MWETLEVVVHYMTKPVEYFILFVPGVDDVAEIWGQGSVVCGTSGFRVWIRLWEVIGRFSGSSEHLSGLVRAVHHLHLKQKSDDY